MSKMMRVCYLLALIGSLIVILLGAYTIVFLDKVWIGLLVWFMGVIAFPSIKKEETDEKRSRI